ncbi:transcriptional regulator GutM [Salinicoccus sp. HZC-1]|uniref:transcriptional regulator GutM n=1 Tax=Salinicoccus sp. HZC-1 TaxID=3385497 RepID=UPI00398AEA23
MFIIMLIIILAIGFGVQYFLGMIQIKHFTKNYTDLRSKGKVVIGRKPTILQSGTLVLLQIDNKNRVEEARYMQGVTVFSKIKTLSGLEGKRVDKLENDDLTKHNRLLRNAILDAKRTFNIVQSGGEVEKIPSPMMQAVNRVNRMFTNKGGKKNGYTS